MKLIDDNELNFLNFFYNTTEKNTRVSNNKKYEFVVLTKSNTTIIDKLCDWFELTSFQKFKNRPTYMFIHSYNIGDYFELHTDDIERGYKNRAYVLGFHINNDYEGGDYILHNPFEIIDKTPGVPYYFKSDRPHQITEITKGYRRSALIFIHFEDLIQIKNKLI